MLCTAVPSAWKPHLSICLSMFIRDFVYWIWPICQVSHDVEHSNQTIWQESILRRNKQVQASGLKSYDSRRKIKKVRDRMSEGPLFSLPKRSFNVSPNLSHSSWMCWSKTTLFSRSTSQHICVHAFVCVRVRALTCQVVSEHLTGLRFSSVLRLTCTHRQG